MHSAALVCRWFGLREACPYLPNTDPLGRKHHVLQTVHVPPVDGGNERSRQETKHDVEREVVLAEAMA